MGRVYRNLAPIDIPTDAFVNHHDNRVFINIDPEVPTRDSRKEKIGELASETTMYPNDNYRRRYPLDWEKHYGKIGYRAYELSSGLYALTLGIVHEDGLYDILIECYGVEYANAILDYAMYSIAEESDVTMDMERRMKNRALFSHELHSDAWYSGMFESIHQDNGANRSSLLRSRWMDKCRERGMDSAWIGIDGSNNDCSSRRCDLAEKGHDKSGRHGSIVGYMYAVNVDTGIPLTYTIYNGGKVDSKAFQEVITRLAFHGIGMNGVVLDRGFCTTGTQDTLECCSYPYVVMLTSDTDGYKTMMEKHAGEVKWQVREVISRKALAGVTDKVRMFKGSKHESTVALYYDCRGGSARACHLIGKVYTEQERIEELLKVNEERVREGKKPLKVAVGPGLRKYLSLVTDKDGRMSLAVNYDAWQKAVDLKGYSAIASSKELSAKEIDHIYHSRDASEKQYMIMKSQLGFSVYRVHDRARIETKQMAVFVASIIRAEIANACKELDYDTKRMLCELDRVKMILDLNTGSYTAINDLSDRVTALFKKFKTKPSDMDSIAREISRRGDEEHETKRQRPYTPPAAEKKSVGRPAKPKPDADPNAPKKKRGRPLGSKNKPKEPEKRKPGRPLGSKDKQPRKPRRLNPSQGDSSDDKK